MEKCGIKVTGTYVVNIDNSYVFDGTLDIQKLFKITDVSEKIQQENETRDVEAVLAEIDCLQYPDAETIKRIFFDVK